MIFRDKTDKNKKLWDKQFEFSAEIISNYDVNKGKWQKVKIMRRQNYVL